MSIFRDSVSHHAGFLGHKADDPFPFTVPNGEQFLSASLGWSVQNFNQDRGARIISQPAPGATGVQRIDVHWWIDGGTLGTETFTYTLTITTGLPGKVIVFEDIDFGGRHALLNLPYANLSGLSDQVSSLVVLQGNWSFYRDADFNSPYLSNGRPIVLGPGIYRWVGDLGITNDDLTSLQAVADAPNP